MNRSEHLFYQIIFFSVLQPLTDPYEAQFEYFCFIVYTYLL